jgi:uncharacterized damage-inducible protein DinB
MAKKKVHVSRKAAGKPGKKKKVNAPSRKRPSAGGASGAKPAAGAHLVWVHSMFEKLLDGFPEDKATFQPSPSDNHLAWTLGHMATAYAWFASLLDGKMMTLPESYNTLFGPQSKPTSDPKAYPPVAELRQSFKAAYDRFTDAMKKLSPADLNKPPAAESHGFGKTRQEVILLTAWHDGWHSGQVSSLRRALGLPPVM